MKIGVISDTHLNGHDIWLERIVEKYFSGTGKIIKIEN